MKREPLNHSNLSELIAIKLKNDIAEGKFKSGDKLPTHDELCEKWGVSRVTIREALKKLEVYGLVEIYQGKGTFVASEKNNKYKFLDFISQGVILKRDSVLSLLEARKVIETELASFAASRATEVEIETLEQHIFKMEQTLLDDDSLEYAVIDFKFHKQIGVLAKNDVLLYMLKKMTEHLSNMEFRVRSQEFALQQKEGSV